MIPAEYVPLVSAVVLATTQFLAIWIATWRLDRKYEKKIGRYVQEFRGSKEGLLLSEIIVEVERLLKSKEGKELLAEGREALKEVRGFFKGLRERAEQATTEDDDDEPVELPTLGSKGP